MAFTIKRVLAVYLFAAMTLLAGCVSPTPASSTTAPSVESPATPTLTATTPPIPKPPDLSSVLPTTNTSPLPDGAVAQLGVGDVSASVSPDRRYFLLESSAGDRLYDFNTLKPMWEQVKPIGLVTWLTDKQSIRIGRYVYNMSSGDVLTEAPKSVEDDRWSPDGHVAAAQIGPSTIGIFDTVTGAQLHELAPPDTLPELPNDVRAWEINMIFSPDGRYLAATYLWAISDGYHHDSQLLAVWDTSSWEMVKLITPVSGWADFTWSPTGNYIVSEYEGTAVWDIDTGLQSHIVPFLSGIHWTPDGQLAAYFGENGLHIADGISLEDQQVFHGVSRVADWFPDGSKLLMQNLAIVDASTGKVISRMPDIGLALPLISDNGQNIIDGKQGGIMVQAWNINDVTQPSLAFQGTVGRQVNIAWSPDNAQIITSNAVYVESNGHNLWNVATGTSLPIGNINGIDWYLPPHVLQWHVDNGYGYVVDRVTSRSGEIIAVIGTYDSLEMGLRDDRQGGVLAFLDAETREPIAEPFKFANAPMSIAWSLDDKRVVLGFDKMNSAQIWDVTDLANLRLVSSLPNFTPFASQDPTPFGFMKIAWAADGQTIAGIYGYTPYRNYCMGCSDTIIGRTQFWDANTGQPFAHPADDFNAEALAFSADGQFIAVGGTNGIVIVWKTHP